MREDLSGQKFNRLLALSRCKLVSPKGRVYVAYLCVCDCGEQKTIRQAELYSGKTKSCGCLMRERTSQANTKHGMFGTPVYSAWSSAIARCHNVNDKDYPKYGGRGITVCDRWRESFENFYADMGDKPSPQHSIDRVDNSLGYSSDNCRWATHTTQNNNRRSNQLLTYNGETKTAAEWSRQTGIKYTTLLRRMDKGWPAEDVLFKPIRYGDKKCRSL